MIPNMGRTDPAAVAAEEARRQRAALDAFTQQRSEEQSSLEARIEAQMATDAQLELLGSRVPHAGHLFTSPAQVQELLLNLAVEQIIPTDGSVQILDGANSLGPVVYGNDGKRVNVIVWSKADPKAAGGWRTYLFNAGLLYYAWKVSPTAHWALRDDPAGYGLVRV